MPEVNADTPTAEIFMYVCWEYRPGNVTLIQVGFDDFTVVYGKSVKRNLTYAKAAKELGGCLMHFFSCMGRADNRTAAEGKADGDKMPQFSLR